jgi:ketosteroid isomerase-like protein
MTCSMPVFTSQENRDMATYIRRMRNGFAVLLVACSLASGVETHAAGKAEAELLELQNQWARARIRGDVQFLERLYAKEFWITAMNGSLVTREQDIGVFASGDMKPKTITNEDMKVSVYGDIAIVVGQENVKGTYKGTPGDFAFRFTNVYVSRDGRWQMVTHHSTPIRK